MSQSLVKMHPAAVTLFPNGDMYEGEHPSFYPHGGVGLIAKIRKVGNSVKTIPNQRMGALLAKVKSAYDNNQSINGLMAQTNVSGLGTNNAENLTHLQLIRLFPEAQGTPVEYFFLDELFIKRDVAMLEYREPFRNVNLTGEYLGRMEESKIAKVDYDEIKYDLPKLVDKSYVPIEDILRTIIDPQRIQLEQMEWNFKFNRNQTAKRALDKIGNPETVENWFDIGSNVHSTNRAASALNSLFNDFLTENDVPITHTAMNAKMLSTLTENTFTHPGGPDGIDAIRVQGGGIIEMPGIPGVTAVIDPLIEDDKIFAINKPNALRLGEGPKIMRRYYDEERDSEVVKKLDFHEYIAVNDQLTKIDRNFGITITVKGDNVAR